MERCLTADDEGPPAIPANREIGRAWPPRQEAEWRFDELRLAVYRYVVCTGLPEADAEEVVQETFLRLYQHLEKRGRWGRW